LAQFDVQTFLRRVSADVFDVRIDIDEAIALDNTYDLLGVIGHGPGPTSGINAERLSMDSATLASAKTYFSRGRRI
jgi:hypothetical protein